MSKKLLLILVSFVIFALSCYLITPANATPRTVTSSGAVAVGIATSDADSSSVSDADSESRSNSRSKATGGDASSRSTSKAKGGDSVSEANGEQSQAFQYNHRSADIPVDGAAAPNVVTVHTNDNCHSLGGATVNTEVLGVSVSKTEPNVGCEARKNSKRFEQLGYDDLAFLSMCAVPENRIVMEFKGYKCPDFGDKEQQEFEVDNSN